MQTKKESKVFTLPQRAAHYSVQDINNLADLQDAHTVVLIQNNIFFAPDAFAALIATLNRSSTFKGFLLSYHGNQTLTNEEIATLTDWLKQSTCPLQFLKLDQLSKNHFVECVNALAHNSSVINLHLSIGALQTSTSLHTALSQMISSNCTITHLQFEEDSTLRSFSGQHPFENLDDAFKKNTTLLKVEFLNVGNDFLYTSDNETKYAKAAQSLYFSDNMKHINPLLLRNLKLSVMYTELPLAARQILCLKAADIMPLIHAREQTKPLFNNMPIELIAKIVAFAHQHDDPYHISLVTSILSTIYEDVLDRRRSRPITQNASSTVATTLVTQSTAVAQTQFAQALKRFEQVSLPPKIKSDTLAPFQLWPVAYERAISIPASASLNDKQRQSKKNEMQAICNFSKEKIKESKEIIELLQKRAHDQARVYNAVFYFCALTWVACGVTTVTKPQFVLQPYIWLLLMVEIGILRWLRSHHAEPLPGNQRTYLTTLSRYQHCLTPESTQYMNRILAGLSDMDRAIDSDQQNLENILQGSAPLPLLAATRTLASSTEQQSPCNDGLAPSNDVVLEISSATSSTNSSKLKME